MFVVLQSLTSVLMDFTKFQLTTRIITRLFHLKAPSLVAEKSLLVTLRKKTGYTFTNCKKALELHNNDLTQAEKWLKEQAQALGWSKATKLEGRQTSQGLIGIGVVNNNAALVEVNCETDFVARNQEFQKMVKQVTESCMDFVKNQQINKVNLNGDQLKNLPTKDGKSLGDYLALMIGNVGENATLKRALCLKVDDGVLLSSYTHPWNNENDVISLGRVGGVVVYKQNQPKEIDVVQIGKSLCQHIVGMNPKRIGTADDQPAKDKDDETCLIHQEYLLDDSLTVKEFLDENQIEVVDFYRFECGENLENYDRGIELLETCQ